MKKQIRFIALAVALSGVAALNVKVALAAKKTYDLTLSRIGTLDEDPEGGINKDEHGVSDCDIYKYNREQAESYVIQVVTPGIKAKGGFSYKGRWIQIGLEVSINATVGFPDCKDSKPNCCLKSHLEKGLQYY
ncbi:hypothetical protein VCM39_14260 [Bacteroides sp. CG01]|uniref:hypothetical protein n=1 Tax=Bacteroides sp. CG01 TaxID=3096000 RepID=UPI002AFF28A6|nr:hypothetical protein [Bacteroides sp. CG01]